MSSKPPTGFWIWGLEEVKREARLLRRAHPKTWPGASDPIPARPYRHSYFRPKFGRLPKNRLSTRVEGRALKCFSRTCCSPRHESAHYPPFATDGWSFLKLKSASRKIIAVNDSMIAPFFHASSCRWAFRQ